MDCLVITFDGWSYWIAGNRFRHFEDAYHWLFPWYRVKD